MNSHVNAGIFLKINQIITFVLAGKLTFIISMLTHPFCQAIGNTSVKNTPVNIGHDINVKTVFISHTCNLA